jgi:hypothetical protein
MARKLTAKSARHRAGVKNGHPAPLPRDVLPIPHREPSWLTTYDAKDPDTALPKIEPNSQHIRPPRAVQRRCPTAPDLMRLLGSSGDF